MFRKSLPAIIAVLMLSSCGDDLPPWMLDTGNTTDTGRDVVSDVTHHDTTVDTATDVPRDVNDVWQDVATDALTDTTTDTRDAVADTTPADHGQIDVADAYADADAAPSDVMPDTADTADTRDTQVVDISLDFGWECVRDDDCTPPVNLGPCEAMSCVEHSCVRGDAPDLTVCDDASKCTTGDMCTDGACGGTDIICDDSNICTNDYCIPASGCATSAKNNVPCNDNNPCTVSDRCSAKVCTGTQMTCTTPPTAACNGAATAVETWTGPGSCTGGTCEYPSSTIPCPDGCANAECILNPCSGVVCDNPPGQCWKTLGECVDGDCDYDWDNSKTCTDNNPCTVDTCTNGTCSSVAMVCDDPPENKCADDAMHLIVYMANGQCQGGSCEYAESTLPCTGGCTNGICTDDPCAGVDCSVASGQCRKSPGECVNGQCEFEADDTASCTDDDACTEGDYCQAGECHPGADVQCDDTDACTAEYCDTATGCVYDDIGDECDDGNDCTDNTCTPLFGCEYPWNSAPCSDDDKCTIGDFCDGGACVPGLDENCDDGNLCTDDSCAPLVGCVNTANAIECRAAECLGLVLRPAAYCSNKSCQYPEDVNCDDSQACTLDSCSTTAGCGRAFSTDICDDANSCTTGDKCQGGQCNGLPVVCNDPPDDYCLDLNYVVRYESPGACVGGGCQYTTNSYSCTFGCSGGVCSGDPCEGIVCRNLTNPCLTTDGTCSGGICTYGYLNSVPCDTDNSVCTTENCQDGTCAFVANLTCNDGDVCTDDDCNPATGCVTTSNTASCDDVNPCTTGDRCSAGTCAGTPVVCDTPPDDECSLTTAVHYGVGPCVNGSCAWTVLYESCTWGCTLGTCNPDPCEGITCDSPGQCRTNGHCVGGGCVYDPLTGTDCDLDSSVCTMDKCLNGACNAGGTRNCDLGNLCEDYGCDPTTGCTASFNMDDCDDDDACTEGDACLLGTCEGGGDKDCSDTNVCTDNGCDPATGCTITDNTATCDDSNLCTFGDICGSGTCDGTLYTCEDLPCAARTCDGSGGCDMAVDPGWCVIGMTCYTDGAENPLNECETCQSGTLVGGWTARTGDCDDKNQCTTTDACIAGQCQGSGAPDCDDSEYCTDDSCIPATGCHHEDRTGPCDDGDPCTIQTTCQMGVCVGIPADCGETTTCIRNWCEPGVGCQSEMLEGTCDDGDPCTIGDQCLFGNCATLGQKNCNDYQSCTTDTCNGGTCVHTKLANLTGCDDGNPCTTGDQCINGYCGGSGPNCDDEDICTDDTCDIDTQTCLNPFNTRLCDDDNACTADDRCASGTCGGTTINCNDNKVCTDDTCDTSTGCAHTPNSQFCDDGDKCTEFDVCAGGSCTAGSTVNCDDHNECTADSCSPLTGCIHDALSQACDDDDLCTYNDYCFNKVCTGIELTCTPVLSCSTAECDGTDECAEGIQPGWCVISGACVVDETRAPGNPCKYCDADLTQTGWSFDDGIPCDDGDLCSALDTCSGGLCGGSPYSCDDSLECTDDHCLGDGTCFNDNPPADGSCVIDNACWAHGSNPDGNVCKVCLAHIGDDDTAWTYTSLDCDDGDECTVDDYCSTGACQPGTPRYCVDGNVCTDDLCESTRPGGCYHPAVTAICAMPRCDGLMYHAAAMCSGTTCPSQVVTNCDDGVQCTTDQCTLTGCVNTVRTGGCDDGNMCTFDDTCSGVACAGTSYSCPVTNECVQSSVCNGDGTCADVPKDDGVTCTGDGNPCTADACDGAGNCTHDAVGDGQTCNDNNLCTSGDSCLGGTCSDGNDVVCQAIDDCHVAGICEPTTGLCSNPLAEDNTTCDDGNACTTGDVCTAGECAGPTMNPCAPLDDCHGSGSCNPTTGLCTYPNLADGTTCDDDNLCTTRDVCSKGACRGLDPISCLPVDTCHYTGTCVPATGLCDWPEKPDGTTCNDSNACTTGTTCTDGACVNGTTKTCTATNNCHYDGTCNTSTGICTNPIKEDGTLCTDGNTCSRDDECVNGTCSGTTYTCSDSKTCTTDTCLGDGTCSFIVNAGTCLIDTFCRIDGQTSSTNACQVCDYETSPNSWTPNTGATCNDYQSNTSNDVCVGTSCTGTPYNCGDGLDCTEDICDGLGGADHYLMSGWCSIDDVCRSSGEVNPANACQKCLPANATTAWSAVDDGLSCDDLEDCSFNDKCLSGICGGTTYSCDDGLSCTLNSCRGDGQCDGSLLDGWCLIWGACVQESDDNPLNNCQQCTTTVSLTLWSPANEGATCDDNNEATTGDVCVSGNCIGTGESCVDGLDCTDDIHTGTGCENPVLAGWCLIGGTCALNGDINTTNRCQKCDAGLSQTGWSANDGGPCNDGNSCTTDDICANQVCSGTQIPCNDGLDCTTDSCEAATCTAEINAGWCVIAGACVASGTVSLTNPCDICNPTVLQTNWSSNDGAVCDDLDDCSHDDACVSRTCRGVEYGCDDGIACTDDSCDGAGGCGHDVQNGWCLIDNNCIAEGETSAWNVCRVCDHALAPDAWSDNVDAVCDDGDLCTWPDNCQGSTCAGTAAPCEDGLECTAQACDGIGGCSPAVLIEGWCMIDGACVPDRAFNPVNPCLICKAEVATGEWSFRNGVVCDDGAECTMFDTCTSGVCEGSPYVCDEQPSCIREGCDGIGGCTVLGLVDGACFIEAVCRIDGDKQPANACAECDTETDPVNWTPLTGSVCDDGQACTYDDTCTTGACAGVPHPCDDGLNCTDNVCDGAGGCSYPTADGWCRIDGVCQADGASHPTLDCTVCAPLISQDAWTHQDTNADEVCNGADDNCDGITDPENAPGCEFYFIDADHDGVGTGSAFRCLCGPDGNWASTGWGDCDDTDETAFPGNDEFCDTVDNNCDGATDEQNATDCQDYYYDYDGDGWGQPGTQRCLCAPDGYYNALEGGDCDDASTSVSPAQAEVCNGVDDDCNGVNDPDGITGCVNTYRDEDVDGYGAEPPICMCSPRGVYTVLVGGDCNDLDGTFNPDGVELCNKVDEDCDGLTDNADMNLACPLDEGVEANGTRSCTDGQCVLTCQTFQEDPPQRAWHDTDEGFMSGCECEADAYEGTGGSTCEAAVDLGAVPDDGTVLTVIGNLPGEGSVDWFLVTMTDPTWNAEPGYVDRYHAKISLDMTSAAEFEVAVTEGSCTGELTCGSASIYDWAVDFWTATLGENPCSVVGNYCTDGTPPDYAECLRVTGDAQRCNSCPAVASPDHHACTDNTRTLLIRVSRHEGLSKNCDSYTMTLSNGLEN